MISERGYDTTIFMIQLSEKGYTTINHCNYKLSASMQWMILLQVTWSSYLTCASLWEALWKMLIWESKLQGMNRSFCIQRDIQYCIQNTLLAIQLEQVQAFWLQILSFYLSLESIADIHLCDPQQGYMVVTDFSQIPIYHWLKHPIHEKKTCTVSVVSNYIHVPQ